MLGDDLIKWIEHATTLGLSTRIVTNGHWGAGVNRASSFAKSLVKAGLKEINFSTGLDHQKFVPLSAVIQAAANCVKLGIFTLITIEADSNESDVYGSVTTDSIVKELKAIYSSDRFRIQRNSWLQFNDSHESRKDGQQSRPQGACEQLFDNLVITPHGNISPCCGLTFENIPDLRLGNVNHCDLETAYARAENDMLKQWLHTDGPEEILNAVHKGTVPPKLITKNRICGTCANMYRDPETRKLIRNTYQEFIPEVMLRFALKRKLRSLTVQSSQPPIERV
jgi:Iron-sulfur cluster-binding domain